MRTLLFLLVAGGAGFYFYHQKHQDPASAEPVKSALVQTTAKAPAPPAAVTQPQPVSEHNWMKRSLDRARDVRDTSRAQTRDSQNP